MITPDAIHFSDSPVKVARQSLPTHLIQVRWSVGEYSPSWVVMLREDGSATVVHHSGTTKGLVFDAQTAAKKTLQALGIQVATDGVDLGNLPPSAPFNFDGVFPGDKEFADLLLNSEFIAWLKSLASSEE